MYVSGLGATLEPRWYTQLFARVKGETEAALAAQSHQRFHALSVRPGAVDPATHDPPATTRLAGPSLESRQLVAATPRRPFAPSRLAAQRPRRPPAFEWNFGREGRLPAADAD